MSVDNSGELEQEKEERMRLRQESIERSVRLNVKEQEEKMEVGEWMGVSGRARWCG